MEKRSNNNIDSGMELNKRQSRNGKDPMESTSPTEHHPKGFGIREVLNVSPHETYEVLWNVGKQILELADQLGVQIEFQGEATQIGYLRHMSSIGVKDDRVMLNPKPRMQVALKPIVAHLKHKIDQVKQVGLDNKSLQSRLLDLGNQVFKIENQQRKIVQRQKYAEQMSTGNLTYVGIRNAANQYSIQALALMRDSVRRSPSALHARRGQKRPVELLRPTHTPPAPPAVATTHSHVSLPSCEHSAPHYSATSPSYDPTSHHFESGSPFLAFSPTSPSYEPSLVHYSASSLSYDPTPHHSESTSTPLTFSPTSPSYEPSDRYEPSSTYYSPTSPSPSYEPSLVHYSATSPSYDLTLHHFESTSSPPGFSPTSPSYKPSF